jgi:hypothetical protein
MGLGVTDSLSLAGVVVVGDNDGVRLVRDYAFYQPEPDEGVPMAGVDLIARFEQIRERATVVPDQVRAAGQRRQDELRSTAGSARNRAIGAPAGLDQAGDDIEAGYATAAANAAESSAGDAIAFAVAAIDAAESAVLSAMYDQTRAALLNP